MYSTTSIKQKVFLFVKIFLPILIYQLANYSASFIDTMMTGQYSTVHLAGVSMATSFWNPLFSFLTGIISALVPIIGQHLGRGDRSKIRQEFHQFIYMSLLLSLAFLGLLLLLARPVLAALDLEPAVFDVAKAYLAYLSVGIVPLFLFSVCRGFFDALGLTKLSMYLMLLLVPFNTGLNYLLIYGKFGLPEMGGAGAGLGTALAYWLLMLVVLGVMITHPSIRAYRLGKFSAFNGRLLWSGFQLGLPIGGSIFAEVAIFAVVGLLMANYSTQMIAAHQSAMNFATLMYAFPVSVSTALPITVSYEIGAGHLDGARHYARIGRILALAFAGFTLTFLYLFRQKIAGLYGSDADFIQLTGVFLTYSLCFQLADAYTAPIQGILRGYKDTRLPFILGVAAYWGVSLPLALILEHWTTLGPYSYWIGLIMGIVASGALLALRLKKVQANLEVIKVEQVPDAFI
ncbi:MATE family multidrug resistance protein [Streptococcus rupicaprae]|uniref:Probable multidrug resistance protein NorM n=1 Tax=Streptococcus rupicaprae TaxID=759619 RepID=A0ABV2FHY4_9STRE